MALYAIGDLQGCHEELCRLLERLKFDPASDQVWFCGDLVNRGPGSLECLRLVRSLGTSALSVLGNHDLHLLAVAESGGLRPGDTLDAILSAADREPLLDWLASRPLAYTEPGRPLLIHAGLAPEWSVEEALRLAAEASAAISGKATRRAFFADLYGDGPERWDPALSGSARLRFIVNCLTRLRFCAADGTLALRYKGPLGGQPPGSMPWFAVPGRASRGQPIVFGHWSALGQVHWPEHKVHGLDTGCVWGGQLSALNLDSGELTRLDCPGHCMPSAGD